MHRNYLIKDFNYKKDYSKTDEVKWINYQANARRRFLLWDLSFEQFKTFKSNCYYCGDKMHYVGIDRINSDEGYNISNCVPCCTMCNRMKSAYNQKEFIKQCQKIARNPHE